MARRPFMKRPGASTSTRGLSGPSQVFAMAVGTSPSVALAKALTLSTEISAPNFLRSSPADRLKKSGTL